tara:strand:- start:3101 stop:3694 length:594 start_codon:yes stop_codon:yes gene_type:complete
MEKSTRSIPRGLFIFVALYMSICSVASFKQGNTEFLMYAAMMAVYIVFLVLLHRKIGFTHTALWLLTIWGCLHMLGGTVPIPERLVDGDGSAVLYSMRWNPNMPRYDQMVHGFGFFAATVACWEVMRRTLGVKSSVIVSICAALMGMGLGALNEVIEFAATRVTETNVGGYVNTGWDLVSNTIGASCAGIWCLNRRV